ncbi:phosphotransferase [Pseudalkalibacillus sp. R45]|uniref:phosphotransferase n=1 Tax=Pseudalkalibacillus sp. R45 TaxID=3457433 RepID=UPI003FCCB8C0
MDIQDIIIDLRNKKIVSVSQQAERLSGGTTSEVYLLDQYVVKINKPSVLKSESYFMTFYKDIELLPEVIYEDPLHCYLVIPFIKGSISHGRINKRNTLIKLVNSLINHYQADPDKQGWGWADKPVDSWKNFLVDRAVESHQILSSILTDEDFEWVMDLVNQADRYNRIVTPYLLHGDCGVHNFIYNEVELCGVIDPTPVFGEPLYDLIYAFCSSPDDLTQEMIESAADHLVDRNFTRNELHEEVVIGLYLRIATCVLHHPNDLDEYLQAWAYWKRTLTKHHLKKEGKPDEF